MRTRAQIETESNAIDPDDDLMCMARLNMEILLYIREQGVTIQDILNNILTELSLP